MKHDRTPSADVWLLAITFVAYPIINIAVYQWARASDSLDYIMVLWVVAWYVPVFYVFVLSVVSVLTLAGIIGVRFQRSTIIVVFLGLASMTFVNLHVLGSIIASV